MNIQILTESPNRVFVDYQLPNLPEEVKSLISDPEYAFYALGPIEATGDITYDFSNNQLYRKTEKGIERVDFTGEFYFGDVFYLNGDKDITLMYKAIFVKGVLDELKLEEMDYSDNQLRKKTLKKIMENIDARNKIFANPFYRWLYRPYAIIVYCPFWLIRHGLLILFKSIDKMLSLLQKILLPI